MELTQRLRQIASLIPQGSVVADIGTDHALLPVYLVQEGICPKVIATEVKDGPWLLAKAALNRFPLRSRVDLRRGNGLTALNPGDADTVVLAGMGGGTIRAILADGPEVLSACSLLILQPMNGLRDVRVWLYENDWHIAAERLALERGHFYVIMAAQPGGEAMPDAETLAIGPGLIENRDPLLGAYLAGMAGSLEIVRTHCVAAGSTAALRKADEASLLLRKIREVGGW